MFSHKLFAFSVVDLSSFQELWLAWLAAQLDQYLREEILYFTEKQRKYTKQGNAHAHQLTLEEGGLERNEGQTYLLSANPPS